MSIFESDVSQRVQTSEKQKVYTLEASKLVEDDLKNCLTNLVSFIFGNSGKKCKFTVQFLLTTYTVVPRFIRHVAGQISDMS